MAAPTQSPTFNMCQDAIAYGVAQSGIISGELLERRLKTSSVFRDRVEKEEFPPGVGYTAKYRTLNPYIVEGVDNAPDMQPFNAGGDGTGFTTACDPTFITVGQPGLEDRVMTLAQQGFQTPLFCALDLQTTYDAEAMMKYYLDNLSMNTEYFVERQVQDAYTNAAEHKVIATGDFLYNRVEGSTSFPIQPPLSGLTQGLLDNIKVEMDFALTTTTDMIMDDGGGMALDLLTDYATSTDLVMQNAGVREDVRFAQEGNRNSVLLNGVGNFMGKVINGYRHMFNRYPWRGDLVNGQWVRIRPFDGGTVVTPQGTRQRVSQAYLTAPFQDSVIFVTGMIKMVAPKVLKRIGPAVFGTPITDYMTGDWQWFNTPGIEGCNRDGTKGFWWNRYIFGFKTLDSQLGYVVRHRRVGVPDAAFNGPGTFAYGTPREPLYGDPA